VAEIPAACLAHRPGLDAAVRLDGDALGLEQSADWTSATRASSCLLRDEPRLELFDEAEAAYVDRLEAGDRVSGADRLAFEVGDSDATAQRLVEAGAEAVAPRDDPVG
jgi:methylmalonyl-CoA/ethylmalonyl-CoA epimerase